MHTAQHPPRCSRSLWCSAASTPSPARTARSCGGACGCPCRDACACRTPLTRQRSSLAAAFGASDADLDALLPPKCDLRVAKAASPSRASHYSSDGVPLVVDTSSKGDWLPSVFALWRAPALLRVITLKHAAVATFLLGASSVRTHAAASASLTGFACLCAAWRAGGADLMLPGVALSPGALAELREGQLCCVCVPGNPAALAVGTIALSGAQAAAAQGKGRLLSVHHVYRDCLWELAPAHAATPNAGFTVRLCACILGCTPR
jgi:translation initiation factor 2D